MTGSDWLTPDWPAPGKVKAVFTTRMGGCSQPPWDSMNLGSHVGDAPEHVQANRATLQNGIGTLPVFLNQVHGTGVLNLDLNRSTPHAQTADACFSTQVGAACTIMVADCLPVLFTTVCGSVVAAAHAGWRGLAGVQRLGAGDRVAGGEGVLETTVAAIHQSFRPAGPVNRAQAAPEIIAWLGPCIGPRAFEVGAEVKAAFTACRADAAQHFANSTDGKYLADLAGLARMRLRALGIQQIYGNDSSHGWCTASNPLRYFSHRRDAGPRLSGAGSSIGTTIGTTGRMAACIWIT